MELTHDEYRRLIDRRGGCTCFLSAPCNQCVEPPDACEAAEILELREEAELEAVLQEHADPAAYW